MYDNWIRNAELRSKERDIKLEAEIEKINKRVTTLEKLVINKQNGREIITEIIEILSNKNELELIKIMEKIRSKHDRK